MPDRLICLPDSWGFTIPEHCRLLCQSIALLRLDDDASALLLPSSDFVIRLELGRAKSNLLIWRQLELPAHNSDESSGNKEEQPYNLLEGIPFFVDNLLRIGSGPFLWTQLTKL